MPSRPTAVAALAALLLVPTLLTACSGSRDGDDAPSAKGNEAGLALASCMRDRGYDFADPDTAGGQSQLSIPEGVDPDAYQADLKECLSSGPVADSGVRAQPAPGQAEADEAYAACLGAAGFDDFPDDTDDWPTYVPADQDAFDAASDTCGDEVYANLGAGNQAG